MSQISNTVLTNEIDWITGVIKGQADAYAGGTDSYDIMVKEQNPDDLINGVDAAVAVNATVSGGTTLYRQFTQLMTWLSQRAVAAGSNNLDAFLAARYQRVSYSYDQLVYNPSYASHLSVGNIFYDDEVNLGGLTHGSTFVAGTALPMAGTYDRMAAEVTTVAGIGGADWHLHVAVTYADGSTGTENVDVTANAPLNTKFAVGELPVTSLSRAGQNIVGMTSTTGMVAGQVVLIEDLTAPALLTENAASPDATITVDPSQVGPFSSGEAVTITDGSNSSSLDIVSIDYRTGVITLSAGLGHAYTVANHSYIQRGTGGVGHRETHAIASVQASTSITLTGNLQHSYHTSGKAYRLIKAITNITTDSGGSTGDIADVVTQAERTI
jgi:hypothetical protein